LHKRIGASLAVLLVLVSAFSAFAHGGGDQAGRAVIAIVALGGTKQVDAHRVACPPIRVMASSGREPSCFFAVVSVGGKRLPSMAITARVASASGGIELGRFRLDNAAGGSWALDALPQVVGTARRPWWLMLWIVSYSLSWSDLTNASLGGSARLLFEVRALE
jgi:hypothetical protein